MKVHKITKREALLMTEKRMAATPFGCGHCLPCKINKAREWTHRMMLEQNCHDASCFVTLTFNEENLPEDGCVSKAILQKFLKRLRRRYEHKKIRYLAVGEYGDLHSRPHYHIAIFGLGPEHSTGIQACWPFGDQGPGCQVGDLCNDSARYISGYCVKKLTRDDDPRLNGRTPEFLLSSRGPDGGIGLPAVRKIANQILSKKYFDFRAQPIIRELRHGSQKVYPLGRYLTQKLIELLGVTDYMVACEVYDYQDKLFEEHCNADTDGSNSYYCNLVASGDQKRTQQAKKQKIWKQRRTF